MELEQVRDKLAAAEEGSAAVLAAMRKAEVILSGGVAVNGFGILRDPWAIRNQLEQAQAHLKESLAAFAAIEWPSNADYDRF